MCKNDIFIYILFLINTHNSLVRQKDKWLAEFIVGHERTLKLFLKSEQTEKKRLSITKFEKKQTVSKLLLSHCVPKK